jgi:DNA mismatch endonuclease, patch repair protein
MTDVHSPLQRSFNMSRIRGKDTIPEKTVRSLLRAEGIRFRSNVQNLPGKPDIVLPAYQTAVFVHGCFWHRHRNCRFTTTPKSNSEFWQAKFARTVVRDRARTRVLRKMGWKVIVVWECTVRLRPDAVRDKILKSINAQQNSRGLPVCASAR